MWLHSENWIWPLHDWTEMNLKRWLLYNMCCIWLTAHSSQGLTIYWTFSVCLRALHLNFSTLALGKLSLTHTCVREKCVLLQMKNNYQPLIKYIKFNTIISPIIQDSLRWRVCYPHTHSRPPGKMVRVCRMGWVLHLLHVWKLDAPSLANRTSYHRVETGARHLENGTGRAGNAVKESSPHCSWSAEDLITRRGSTGKGLPF